MDADEVDYLTEKDLYKILGVAKGAKQDEIKKAYRTKSLKYHPDKNPAPEAKPTFQKITEAYSILSDDKKRLRYDKSGDMDLEDFDMDQFMNMWVGEMMEDGGMVDDMMKEVLPWSNDEEKMLQFLEEKVQPSGKKLHCTICKHTASNQKLMFVHFDTKHKFECEEWANDTLKSMKASFESFMKQVTGIGNDSGEFILPDGTKADMSKVKGVPDIRAHMQKRVDKAKEVEAVMDMYRKVAAIQEPDLPSPGPESENRSVQATPDLPEPKQISEVLGVSLEEAQTLRNDKDLLLRTLRVKIDQLNDEEDEEEAMMEAMGGMGIDGLDGFGGKGAGGKGGLPGFGGMMGDLGGLEELLGGMDMDMDLDDPAALQALMAQLGGMPGMGMPGMGMPGVGMPGMGMPGMGMPGMEGMGGLTSLGGRGGKATGSREPPRPSGPSKEIGCKCGYSCGTMTALEKHLSRFTGPEHEAVVTERPPSPPRVQLRQGDDKMDDILSGYCREATQFPGRPGMTAEPEDDKPELACICGYSCGTEKALVRHMERFPGNPSHARK